MPGASSSQVGQRSPRKTNGGREDICFFAHGVGGTDRDWDLWVEILEEKLPTWKLKPLETLAAGCRFMGSGVDALASLAASEIIDFVQEEQKKCPSRKLTLHFVGHSMGGLIMRGAMPEIARKLEKDSPEFGHYLSLSTPHLGIQSSWLAPLHAWRNLCVFTGLITRQLVQLSIADSDGDGRRPYLVALGDAKGSHMSALKAFRVRTCVSLVSGDPLIPMSSGLMDPDLALEGPGLLSNTHWRFEQRSGLHPSGLFETALRGTWHHPASDLTSPGMAAVRKQPGPTCGLFGDLIRLAARFIVGICALVAAAFELLRCRRALAETPSASEDKAYQHMQHGGLSADEHMQKMCALPEGRPMWRNSWDSSARFPVKLAVDLDTVPWQRIAVNMHHRPLPQNKHVFLIGKKAEQFVAEHAMSRQCIECLAEILAD